MPYFQVPPPGHNLGKKPVSHIPLSYGAIVDNCLRLGGPPPDLLISQDLKSLVSPHVFTCSGADIAISRIGLVYNFIAASSNYMQVTRSGLCSVAAAQMVMFLPNSTGAYKVMGVSKNSSANGIRLGYGITTANRASVAIGSGGGEGTYTETTNDGVAGDWNTLVHRYSGGKRMWFNGILTASGTGTYDTAATVPVIGRAGGAVATQAYFDGMVGLAAWWASGVSDPFAEKLSNSPLDLLTLPPRRFFITLGGGTPISTVRRKFPGIIRD